MAKVRLRPQQKQLFQFLADKEPGDIVTAKDILDYTHWKRSTLTTYESKHLVDPFLTPVGKEQYKVLRDGSTISMAEMARAFTQKRDGKLAMVKGEEMKGGRERYVLVKYLGEGAVAHVWEATVIGSTEKAAIKVMNPRPDLLNASTLANVTQRFGREAKNGLTLNHVNVVRYRDTGDIQGYPFVAMDLADSSLKQKLKQGRLGLADSLPIVRACLDGLKYLHGLGCIHRDVKPANILCFGARVVLGDLGIVRWSDMSEAFTSAGTITRDSVQLGSWYYMAPEQRQSPHQATVASDVYALGISWYEMLTGVTLDPAAVGAKQYQAASSVPAANEIISAMIQFESQTRPTVDALLESIDKIG